MSERTYRYKVAGTAADDQTWEYEGTVALLPGNFPLIMEIALRESFMALTQGRAVFGKPGVGCQGPYSVKTV